MQYPKRQTARGMQQERSHLPIKLNTAGVIPPIFASSLLLMPLTILQWAGNRATAEGSTSDWLITISTFLQHGSPLYMALYGVGIAFFCFFYTAVQFNSEETADNLKRHGGSSRASVRKATDLMISAQPHHGRGCSSADLPHPEIPSARRASIVLAEPASDRRQRDDGYQPDPDP